VVPAVKPVSDAETLVSEFTWVFTFEVSEPSEDEVPYSNHLDMARFSVFTVPFNVAAPALVTPVAASVTAVGVLLSTAVLKPLKVVIELELSQLLNVVPKLAFNAASSFAAMSSS